MSVFLGTSLIQCCLDLNCKFCIWLTKKKMGGGGGGFHVAKPTC